MLLLRLPLKIPNHERNKRPVPARPRPAQSKCQLTWRIAKLEPLLSESLGSERHPESVCFPLPLSSALLLAIKQLRPLVLCEIREATLPPPPPPPLLELVLSFPLRLLLSG